MAQTTIELRHLLQAIDPATGQPFQLFDFEYSFDDILFAGQLEQAVIDYYYFHEIGQETPDRFKQVFKRTWLQMIGYYNRIHNIDLIEYDPLITYRMEETYTGEAVGKQIAKGATNADTYQTVDRDHDNHNSQTIKTSDYPQSVIGSGFQNGESQTDAADAGTEDTTIATSDKQTVDNSIDDTKSDTYSKLTEGFTGRGFNSVGLVQQYMESVPRLTGQVINELKACFILIY